MRISDTFRVSKGLKPLNETAIKQFTGSSFDTDSQKSIHDNERYMETNIETNTVAEVNKDNTDNKVEKPINPKIEPNKPISIDSIIADIKLYSNIVTSNKPIISVDYDSDLVSCINRVNELIF
ncbi:hypothetical protein EZS27_038179 [termite gut metagenome]|uniref:Uncharacterized protein n=1 Tax=termite gut metagenome TaxID=433724 RepID=A0A5J4PMZ7_9ZZZZ